MLVLPLPEPVVLSAAEEAVASLGAVDPRATIHVRSSWMPGANGAGMLWVVGEVDAQARRDPAWAAGASAEISLRAQGDAVVFSREAMLPAGALAFAVGVPDDGPLSPGEYTLRVRVSAPGMLPYTETRTIHIEGGPSSLGEPVLFRRGPSTGRRYAPTADPRFLRTEQLRLEVPTTAGPGVARLLDRTGAPLSTALSVTERHDAGAAWLVVDVPVGGIAPGDYVVEVAQEEAIRLTAFRVMQ